MGSGYEVRFCSDKKGMGLFATKQYEVNDVIFEEKPIVSSQFAWNESYGYLACHHCMRPLESTEENVRRLTANRSLVLPFPELCPTDKSRHSSCDQCNIGFCCESCKQTAWQQYHEYLCFTTHPELKTLYDTWKQMHFPPETASIMLLVRIIAAIEGSENKELAVSTFLEFSHGTIEERDGSLLKFLGNEFSGKLTILQSIISDVLPTKYAKSFVSDEGLRTLFALVSRNSQGIGTSVFSSWVKNVENHPTLSQERRQEVDVFIDKIYEAMDDHVGTFLNNEGSGLYKLERCMNHNCDPNGTITYPKGDFTLAVVAKREIQPGEEICISYIDECDLERSRHSRNKHLREYYLFDCQCEKCISQADEPDVTSDEESQDEDMQH